MVVGALVAYRRSGQQDGNLPRLLRRRSGHAGTKVDFPTLDVQGQADTEPCAALPFLVVALIVDHECRGDAAAIVGIAVSVARVWAEVQQVFVLHLLPMIVVAHGGAVVPMAVAVYGVLHAGLPVERLVVELPLFVAAVAAVAFGQHVVAFLLPSASIVQVAPEVDVVAPQELVADGGFVLRPPTGFAASVVVVAHVHQHAHQFGTVAECRVEYDDGTAYPRRILREPAVALKASAGVMAVVDAQLVAKPDGLLQCKSVAATHLEITITLVADVTRELVAIGQEVLGGRARLLVLTYAADFEVHVLGPALVLVVDREAHAALLHVGYTLALCFCSAPFTLAAWAVEFVDVVAVEEDVDAGVVGVALAEGLGSIRSPTQ